MGQEVFFLWVKEIKLHLQDPGQRYIDTEINFNIFIGLSNSSTYFNFNKCFIVQKSMFGSFAINSDLRRNRYRKGPIFREFSDPASDNANASFFAATRVWDILSLLAAPALRLLLCIPRWSWPLIICIISFHVTHCDQAEREWYNFFGCKK